MILRSPLRSPLRPALRSPFTLGGVGFAVAALFAASEPGAHFETYNPDSLVQRRNLLTYSEQFDNAAWVKQTGATVIANDAVAPDGTLTADKLVYDGSGAAGGIRVLQNTGTTPAPGLTVTGSVYLRADAPVTVRIQNNLTADETVCNLTTQWQRFSVSSTQVVGGAGTFVLLIMSTAGNNAAFSIHVWGAQGERAATASTYQKVTDWNTEYMAAALERIGMWQDNLGTAPVTAVEQTVGMWMDGSKGQSWARGAELLATASLDFRSGWAAQGTAVANSALSFTTSGTAGEGFSKNVGLVVGQWYEVVCAFTKGLSGSAFMLANASSSASPPATASTSGTSGVTRGVFQAGSPSLYFRLSAAADTVTITSISLRQVTGAGNHATQSSSTSRPKLSARYNLLTKTEQFDDAAWLKLSASISANVAPGPFGGGGADFLTEAAATSVHATYQQVTSDATGYVFQVYAKAGSRSWLQIRGAGSAANGRANFNLGTGQLGTVAADCAASITDVGGGWYLCRVTGTWATSGAKLYYACVANADFAGDPTYAGDGSSGLYLWGADLRTASDAALSQPAYQRVNTATDYDTAGFIHYLRFDGSDDSLQTPAINFSTGAKMAVWAGQTKLSDAATAILAELTAAASSTDGGFYVASPAAAAANFGAATRGTVAASAGSVAGFASPSTQVLTAQMDNAAATNALQNILRANGAAQVLTYSTGPTTAGNYANAVLNIGRRNNLSLPFNGRLTSLTVRGSATPASASFIKQMEQYAARLAGQSFVST